MKSRTKKQNRPTIGSIYNQAIAKQEIHYDNEEDMIKAMANPQMWEEWLWQLVDAYKEKYPGRNGFIQLLQIRDRFIATRVTLKWVARFSCPDPWFDESVWMYHAKEDELEYLWSLPDKETCDLFIKHRNNVIPEEQWMLKHIIDCKDGKLDELARHLNGERKDSVHILLKEVPENLIVN